MDTMEERNLVARMKLSKWVEELGGGFHPDNRGESYVVIGIDSDYPALTVSQIEQYNSDLDYCSYVLRGDIYAVAQQIQAEL